MQRALAVGALVSLAVAALPGCRLFERPAAPPPPLATWPVADEERLDWAAEEPFFVVVRKSCRTLDVYRHGERIRSYPAVFGYGGTRDKLYEGDRRTPNGLYAIIEKRRHPRWRWFFLLDYPNGTDWHRYWTGVAAGTVPRGVGIGGSVGIHGTDRPESNRRGIDWTWGCVSVDNDSIEDLAALLPLGTLVLIQE